LSRRTFLQHAVAGAGATAAAAVGANPMTAAGRWPAPSPRRAGNSHSAEFAAAHGATLPKLDFPLTGAQVFARACRTKASRPCSAVRATTPSFTPLRPRAFPLRGRHEGSMAHAADAFIRSTGELAVCSGTEGPGFTDMICAIACANAARTPLLVLASNMSIYQEDTEAGIQLGYQQADHRRAEEYGKRLINLGACTSTPATHSGS